MKLPSHELRAFYEVARIQNVTQAARNLFVTQSALSQRIQKLESTLESTLFIRDRKGLRLTENGEKLLRYCQSLGGLEAEFLEDLQSNSKELAGTVRLASYSSVMRSAVIPSVAPFLRKNTKVQCEFRSYEVSELEAVLERAEADLVIADFRMQKPNIEEVLLGAEEFVVIESARFECPENIYLDHGPEDNATSSFFAAQKNAPAYNRSYMGDVYGILDGVEEGLGRAVMSKHLIKNRKNLKVVKGFKSQLREVVLHYFKRPYYPKIYKEVVKTLKSNMSV
jgi:DNA-binding transcriptional LysR family regulator